MENSKYIMEYETPKLLAPNYRYAITKGNSLDCLDGNSGDHYIGDDL